MAIILFGSFHPPWIPPSLTLSAPPVLPPLFLLNNENQPDLSSSSATLNSGNTQMCAEVSLQLFPHYWSTLQSRAEAPCTVMTSFLITHTRVTTHGLIMAGKHIHKPPVGWVITCGHLFPLSTSHLPHSLMKYTSTGVSPSPMRHSSQAWIYTALHMELVCRFMSL